MFKRELLSAITQQIWQIYCTYTRWSKIKVDLLTYLFRRLQATQCKKEKYSAVHVVSILIKACSTRLSLLSEAIVVSRICSTARSIKSSPTCSYQDTKTAFKWHSACPKFSNVTPDGIVHTGLEQGCREVSFLVHWSVILSFTESRKL